jgi:glucose 1-dehydrogenase
MTSTHKEQRLSGEIAIVTGSDSEISQATAIAFAREDADVAITYLEDKAGENSDQLPSPIRHKLRYRT